MYRNATYKNDDDCDLELNSKLSCLTDTTSVSERTNNLITLKEYIEKKKLKYGDKTLTHQWWNGDENTNFKINDNEYDEFLQVYYKELKREKKILHVMEQPKEIGPLCLDFDLKQTSPQRTICTDDIMQIISIVNDIVYRYYSFKDKKVLDSYVFMKKEPFFNKKKLLYSDGFHLQYPKLILNSADRFLIYHESRKEIIRQDLFSNIYSILVNVNNLKEKDSETQSDDDSDSEDNKNNYYSLDDTKKEKINDEIFDPSVIIRNKWFMYYSGKNIDGETNVYHLHCIFDYNIDEIEDIPKTKELVKLLSIRNPTNENNLIHGKDTNEYNNIIEIVKTKYLKKKQPQLDINKLFKEPDNQEKIQSNTNDKIVNLINQNNYKYSNQDDIQYAKKLIKLLNANRSKPYEDWIRVGWTLYNISPSLLPEFLEFSKKAGKKYDEEGCIKIWDDCSKRYNNTGYTIASLVRWTKEDNLDGYKKLLREKINSMLDKGDMVDFDIACILREIYKYEYKCSSISKGVWWQYDNHIWNSIECAHTFSIKMSTEIANEFATLQYDLMKLAVLEVGQKADILNKRCKDIMNLVFNLKKGAYKDRIIKECSYLFYEKDFVSKLDQNNYLIGFTNGVYDLRNKNNVPNKDGIIKYEPYGFRKGCPDDMVGKTTGYDYVEYLMHDEIIKDINKFIESIQPEEDMRTYLMVYCSSFLEGSNKDQKFMIWTGSGMNGKGSLIDLLDNTFNGTTQGYFGTLPPTVLTQKRGSSSSATPELADKFGKRIITLQEPEGDDKIHVGFMKNITGQDKIEARPLYGDPFQYTPQFKLLLACNHLPNIPSDDGGTWRRIRVIDFAIKFTLNPQNQNERKSDPKLREKMKKWHQAFMWILINKYYPIYVENEGMDNLEPERVKSATDKYKADSNIIMEFFNEELEAKTDSHLPMSYVYNQFNEWYKNSYNDKKPFPKRKLKEYFDNNNFKIVNEYGEGLVIKGIGFRDPKMNINELDD